MAHYSAVVRQNATELYKKIFQQTPNDDRAPFAPFIVYFLGQARLTDKQTCSLIDAGMSSQPDLHLYHPAFTDQAHVLFSLREKEKHRATTSLLKQFWSVRSFLQDKRQELNKRYLRIFIRKLLKIGTPLVWAASGLDALIGLLNEFLKWQGRLAFNISTLPLKLKLLFPIVLAINRKLLKSIYLANKEQYATQLSEDFKKRRIDLFHAYILLLGVEKRSLRAILNVVDRILQREVLQGTSAEPDVSAFQTWLMGP